MIAERDTIVDVTTVGAGISLGFALGASVIVLDVDGALTAVVGNGVQIGQAPGLSVNGLQVRADSDVEADGAATAIAGAAVALAAAVSSIESTIAVTALIGAATIQTSGGVVVNSRSRTDLISKGIGVSGGLGAAGASVSFATIGGSNDARVEGANITSASLQVLAGDTADLHKSLTDGLAAAGGVVGVAGTFAKSTVGVSTRAELKNSTVSTSDDVTLRSIAPAFADSETDGAAGGVGAVGVSSAESILNGTVDASVSGGTVSAGSDGSGSISVTAGNGGWREYQAVTDAGAAAGGVVGGAAANAESDVNIHTTARSLGATLSAAQDVSITSIGGSYSETVSDGKAGGVVAAGGSVSSAAINGSVATAVQGGSITAGQDIRLEARDLVAHATSQSNAGAGGVGAAVITSATSSVSNPTKVSTASAGLDAGRDVFFDARADQDSVSNVRGTVGGAIAVGIVRGSASISGRTEAIANAGTTIAAGGNVSIRSDGTMLVTTDALGGKGGGISVGAGSGNVNATNRTHAAVGANATVGATGDVHVEAATSLTARSIANLGSPAELIGAANVKSTAIATSLTVAEVGTNATVSGADVDILSTDRNVHVEAKAVAETDLAGVANNEAETHVDATVLAVVRVGAGAEITVPVASGTSSTSTVELKAKQTRVKTVTDATSEVTGVAGRAVAKSVNLKRASAQVIAEDGATINTLKLFVEAWVERNASPRDAAGSDPAVDENQANYLEKLDADNNTATGAIVEVAAAAATVVGEVFCLWGAICDAEAAVDDVVNESGLGLDGQQKNNYGQGFAEPFSEAIVDFNADVNVGGGGQAKLDIDKDGKVTDLANVRAYRSLADLQAGSNVLAVGQSVTTGTIYVDDIRPLAGGQIRLETRQLNVPTSEVTLGGPVTASSLPNKPVFTLGNAFDLVRIRNFSDNDLFLNDVEMVDSTPSSPEVVVSGANSSLFVAPGQSDRRPNTAPLPPGFAPPGTSLSPVIDNDFDYILTSAAAGSRIEILQNFDEAGGADVPKGNDVTLLGRLETPTGTVVLNNQDGSILANATIPAGSIPALATDVYVRAETLDADSRGGTVGALGSDGVAKPLYVRLARAGGLRPTLAADGQSGVFLDVVTAGAQSDSLDFFADGIHSSGGDVEVLFTGGLRVSAAGTAPEDGEMAVGNVTAAGEVRLLAFGAHSSGGLSLSNDIEVEGTVIAGTHALLASRFGDLFTTGSGRVVGADISLLSDVDTTQGVNLSGLRVVARGGTLGFHPSGTAGPINTIGSASAPFSTDVGAGGVNAWARGEVRVTEAAGAGDLRVGLMESGSAEIFLGSTSGSIVDAAADSTLDVVGTTVHLTALQGGIGASPVNSYLDVGSDLRATARDAVFVAGVDGDLNVLRVESTQGSATVDARTGNASITEMLAPLGTAAVFARDSILDANADVAADVRAVDITLRAGTDGTGGIGVSSNHLEIDQTGTGLGGLTATAPGDIFVDEAAGADDLRALLVESTGANVLLEALQGGVLAGKVKATSAGATARVIASANILDLDTAQTSNIDAETVDLTAGAGIGTAANHLEIDSSNATTGGLNATAPGDIFVDEAAGAGDLRALMVESTGADVRLEALQGDVLVGKVRATSPGATAYVIASANILDLDSAQTSNIDAETVDLTAGAGIGTAANHLEIDSSNAATGGLNATAPGNIFVDEASGAGDLRALQVESTAGDVRIEALEGDVEVGKVEAKSAGATAYVIASDDITDLDGGATSNIDAVFVDLTAGTDGTGVIGTAADHLEIDSSNATTGGLKAAAPGVIYVDEAENAGDLRALRVRSSGDDVHISSISGNVLVQNVEAKNGTAFVTALQSILDLPGDEVAKILAVNVNLTASLGTIGLAGDHFEIDSSNSTAGGLVAVATGKIFIDEAATAGDLNVFFTESVTDNVRLEALGGSTLVAEVRATSATAFIFASDDILDLVGNADAKIFAIDLNLTAGTDGTGGIGTATDHLEIDSSNASTGGLTATAPGKVFVDEAAGAGDLRALFVESTGDDVRIEALEGNVRVQVVEAKAAGATAFVLASDDIVDLDGAQTSNINAVFVDLKAGTDGTGGVGSATDRLEIDTSNAFTGGLFALAPDKIFVDEAAGAGDLRALRVESTGDNVRLEALTGSALVDRVLAKDGTAFLHAANDISDLRDDDGSNVDAIDIDLTAGKDGTGGIGTSANDLDIDSSNASAGELRAVAPGSIYIREFAGGGVLNVANVRSTGSDIRLTSADTAGTGDDMVILPSGLVDAAGSVLLRAGDDFTSDASAVIDAAGTIEILGDFGNADSGTGSNVTVQGTVRSTENRIRGEADRDVLLLTNIAELVGETWMFGGGDRDQLIADRLPSLIPGDTVHLDGEGDKDFHRVNTTGASRYLVDVHDSGALGDGADVLEVNGTAAADTFLLRGSNAAGSLPGASDKAYLALLQETPGSGFSLEFERVNYDETINGRLQVHAGEGDDAFFVDDNAAITTLDGGAGEDTFQIGQLFGEDPALQVALPDRFPVTETTRGFLSRGISHATTLLAGGGDDEIAVYSNKAVLRIEGGEGNDSVTVRAFALKDQSGLTPYNMNAPVELDGGPGVDDLTVVATELADALVTTESGIFGAGLSLVTDGRMDFVRIDAVEGDDHFFNLGSNSAVIVEEFGGKGSDTFENGGDVTEVIYSVNLGGRSSFINHDVQSAADTAYDGQIARGVDVTVASGDANGVVALDETAGETAVVEDLAGSVDTYTVSMARPASGLAAPTAAFVTVSAALAVSDQRNQGGRSIQVSADGVEYFDSIVLTFDSVAGTWDVAQQVYVRAASDTLSEGALDVVVSHRIQSTDATIDDALLRNVTVRLFDDESPTLVVEQTNRSTAVLEGVQGFSDSYGVRMSAAPAAGETVTVTVQTDSQVRTDKTTLTFDSTNWSTLQTVTVTAEDDSVAENEMRSRISHSLTTSGATAVQDPEDLRVTVYDDDTPTVLIEETDGGTLVGANGLADTYTVRLSSAPSGPVTVRLFGDGQTTLSSSAPGFSNAGAVPTVTFDAGNWFTPVEVRVEMDPTFVPDPNAQFVRRFAVRSHLLHRFFGPLVQHAGVGNVPDLATATMLPPEIAAPPLPSPVSSVDEALQTDRIHVYNDSSRADDTGRLHHRTDVTAPTHIVDGFGMGGDLQVDLGSAGVPNILLAAGGLSFDGFEIAELLLGTGDDDVTVAATEDGAITAVHAGGGDDKITVTGGGGPASPLILLGDTARDRSRFDSTVAAPTGDAYPFDEDGDDTIDVSASQGAVTVYAGDGDDIVRGSQAGDHILGGSGDDDLSGLGGQDHVYGDSSLNVSLGQRLSLTGQVLTLLTDDAVGNDTVSGGDDEDILFGDHGILTQSSGILRLVSTGNVIQAETTSFDLGGDDTMDGGDADDRIFGGLGSDTARGGAGEDIVFGDHGFWVSTWYETIEALSGSDDTLYGGGQNDVVFGGVGSDTIFGDDGPGGNPGSDGDDILLGDQGRADLDLAAVLGANTDLVTGRPDLGVPLPGDPADSGRVAIDSDSATLDRVTVTSPFLGAADTISGDGGEDVIFGGSGADELNGDAGIDTIFGDHARHYPGLTLPNTFGIVPRAFAGAGGDLIRGGEGHDRIFGQQGTDTLFGDAGDDDITGGHNVLGAADEGDFIHGGDGADVVIGDNGLIERFGTLKTPSTWAAPFAEVVRKVTLFGDQDAVAGDDRVFGEAGQDIIFGDLGNDEISGGAGDDEIIGGGGNDRIRGEEGRDTILGDRGRIVRDVDSSEAALGDDGLVLRDATGFWHRDIFLEEAVRITGSINTSTTPVSAAHPNLAETLVTTDMLLMAGVFTANGQTRYAETSDGLTPWETSLLLLSVEGDGADVIDGGDDADRVFGQRGNDIVRGGDGDDLLVGDGADSVVPYDTSMPSVFRGMRVLSATGAGPIHLDHYGTFIMPPATMTPDVLHQSAPFVMPAASGVIASESMLRVEREVGVTTLPRSNDALIRPYATIIPDVVHHASMLPGNDDLFGGSGDDFVVGDNLGVIAPMITGFKEIDGSGFANPHKAREQHFTAQLALHVAMRGMDLLALDYDQLLHLKGNDDGVGDVVVAGDAIGGGDGNDLLFGDDGVLVGAPVYGVPLDSGTYVSGVLDSDVADAMEELQGWMTDVRQAAVDLQFVIYEAQKAVAEEVVTFQPGKTAPLPDNHELFLGNDQMTGGAGDDLLFGDHSVVLTALVTGREIGETYPGVEEETPLLRAIEAEIRDREVIELGPKGGTGKLQAHIAAHHAGAIDTTISRAVLRKMRPIVPHNLITGNDGIDGNDGVDVVVGDFGVVAIPLFEQGRGGTPEDLVAAHKAAEDLGRYVKYQYNAGLQDPAHRDGVLTSIYGLEDKYRIDGSKRGAKHRATLKNVSLSAGNDGISGGRGDDFLLGDDAVVSITLAMAGGGAVTNIDNEHLQLQRIESGRTKRDVGPYFAKGRSVSIANDVIVGDAGADILVAGAGKGNRLTLGSGDQASKGKHLKKDLLDILEQKVADSLNSQLVLLANEHVLAGDDPIRPMVFDADLGGFVLPDSPFVPRQARSGGSSASLAPVPGKDLSGNVPDAMVFADSSSTGSRSSAAGVEPVGFVTPAYRLGAQTAVSTGGVQTYAVGAGASMHSVASRPTEATLLFVESEFGVVPAEAGAGRLDRSARIAADARVSDTALFGEGVVVEAGAIVEAGAHLEDDVYVGKDAYVGAGAILGAGVVLAAGAVVPAGARLEGAGIAERAPSARTGYFNLSQWSPLKRLTERRRARWNPVDQRGGKG